ncbi:MAG TPA: substrate-binding domain-containing protein [Candidatus Limnocylindrales bacterium]
MIEVGATERAESPRRRPAIGLVFPEQTTHVYGDPFFARLLQGIRAEMGETLALVLMIPYSADESRLESYLTAGELEGVLLASLHGADPLPARLHGRGVPVVISGRPPVGATVTYVDVDNEHGAQSAVRHLVEIGRRRIATVAGPQDMPAGIDRLLGYRIALEEAGLPPDPDLVAVGDFSPEGAARATGELLQRRPDFDALFAASDLMAANAVVELKRAGRRIPDDVAVVGFDDSPLASALVPALSSVRQPIEEMGREMVRLLREAIGPGVVAPRHVILDTELVIRASSARRRPT